MFLYSISQISFENISLQKKGQKPRKKKRVTKSERIKRFTLFHFPLLLIINKKFPSPVLLSYFLSRLFLPVILLLPVSIFNYCIIFFESPRKQKSCTPYRMSGDFRITLQQRKNTLLVKRFQSFT